MTLAEPFGGAVAVRGGRLRVASRVSGADASDGVALAGRAPVRARNRVGMQVISRNAKEPVFLRR